MNEHAHGLQDQVAGTRLGEHWQSRDFGKTRRLLRQQIGDRTIDFDVGVELADRACYLEDHLAARHREDEPHSAEEIHMFGWRKRS